MFFQKNINNKIKINKRKTENSWTNFKIFYIIYSKERKEQKRKINKKTKKIGEKLTKKL